MNKTALLLSAAVLLTLVAVTSKVATPPPMVPSRQVLTAPIAHQPELPSSGLGVTTQLSQTRVEANGALYAQLDVTAANAAAVASSPVSIALVVDCSGSMASDQKMERAKQAAHQFIARLGPTDQLAIVSFSERATSTDLMALNVLGAREQLDATIDGLQPTGSTNVSDGLAQATRVLNRASGIRRVVLISDGQPTVGTTDSNQLGALVQSMHANRLTVTALGVGTDYDARLMQLLADRGGGFFGYLDQPEALSVVLSKELEQARHTIAHDVTLELSADDDLRDLEVAGYTTVAASSQSRTVALPDFSAGLSSRVFVRMTAKRSSGTGSLRATLRWSGLNGERHVSTTQEAVVAFTDDAEIAKATRNELVFAAAIRAIGSQQYLAASAALERGDTATATNIFDNVRTLFASSSAEALAGDIKELDQTRARVNSGHYDARGENLALSKKGLRNFGMNNSY